MTGDEKITQGLEEAAQYESDRRPITDAELNELEKAAREYEPGYWYTVQVTQPRQSFSLP